MRLLLISLIRMRTKSQGGVLDRVTSVVQAALERVANRANLARKSFAGFRQFERAHSFVPEGRQFHINRIAGLLIGCPMMLGLASCASGGEKPDASNWCDKSELITVHNKELFDTRIHDLISTGRMSSNIFNTGKILGREIHRSSDYYILQDKYILYKGDISVATLINRSAFKEDFFSQSGFYPDHNIWSCGSVNRAFWDKYARIILTY